MYDPDHFRLEGQVAIVTGGGAGIGRAIARTFAGAGAAVVVSDLRPDDADEAANEIQRSGGRAVAVACDVTEPDDLARLVDTANERFGSLTTLVSNAGGGGPKPFDMDMADFRRAYELNVFSLFQLAQLAAPLMEEAGGGAILAITSMAATHGRLQILDRAAAPESTGHGSALPYLKHGGPGRAGGGEELGGLRAVKHLMQRAALQGSPAMLAAVTGETAS